MPFLLKNFQQRTVEQLEQYFTVLSQEHEKFVRVPEAVQKEYGEINWPKKAWHVLYPAGNPNNEYISKKTGHDKQCPHFCKLPTGGGKTLMATYALGQYLKHLKKQPAGLVLWVVPSEQIFAQTLGALKDRSHPYREKLDDITGGHIKIVTNLGVRKEQDFRKPEYKKSLEEFLLPIFVTRDSQGNVRDVDFAYDILHRIDYGKIDLSSLKDVHLDSKKKSKKTVTAFNFSATTAVDQQDFLAIKEKEENPIGSAELRRSYFVRNILDFVPNPWVGKQVIDKALDVLKAHYSEEQIAENQILILDEIRAILAGDNVRLGEINRLAREVFIEMIKNDEIRFVLRFDADAVLTREKYFEGQGRESFKMSLFEPVVRGSMNDFERDFALFVEDKKDRTYWWYRNKPKDGYYLVGWQRNKCYPDFIFTAQSDKPDAFQKIFVVETKGAQLARTEDTEYKRELVKEYNDFFGKLKAPWGSMDEKTYAAPKKVQFELVTQSDWKSEVNRLLEIA